MVWLVEHESSSSLELLMILCQVATQQRAQIAFETSVETQLRTMGIVPNHAPRLLKTHLQKFLQQHPSKPAYNGTKSALLKRVAMFLNVVEEQT